MNNWTVDCAMLSLPLKIVSPAAAVDLWPVPPRRRLDYSCAHCVLNDLRQFFTEVREIIGGVMSGLTRRILERAISFGL